MKKIIVGNLKFTTLFSCILLVVVSFALVNADYLGVWKMTVVDWRVLVVLAFLFLLGFILLALPILVLVDTRKTKRISEQTGLSFEFVAYALIIRGWEQKDFTTDNIDNVMPDFEWYSKDER